MRQFRKAGGRAKGFTLIELMIAVAILALIAAVAIPSYTKQLQKNQRAVAKARLAQAAQQLERFYSDNNTYYMDITTTPCALVSSTTTSAAQMQNGLMKLMNPPWACAAPNIVYSGTNNETTSAYQITVTAGSSNTFTLLATAVGNQTADTLCGNLTLTNAGVKGISGSGSVATCW